MRDVATGEVVELVVPADLRYLSAARVVAATLASEVGFDVDDLERVRVGVNELAAVLIEALHPFDRLTLQLRQTVPDRGEARITVVGSADGEPAEDSDDAGRAPVAIDALAERILAAVADEYTMHSRGFEVTFVAGSRPRPVPTA